MFTYDLFQRQLLSDNFFDSEFANTGSSSDVSIVSRFMLSDSLVDMNLLKSASSKLIVSTPFAFPFSVRVDIFYRLIARDRELAEGRNIHFSPGFGEQITVRRDKLVEDSLLQINPLKNRLKGRVRISFVSSEGLPEAGIDGGGLFKEFLITFCTQAFNPALGLFRETDSRYLYPNPMSDQLDSFELLGRVVGKALYESILVQPQFANFFLRKLQGRTNFKNELSSLDKHLQDSAHFLKNYSGDFSALSLTFSSSRDGAGAAETVDLIPNGREVAVTAESKLTFIALLSHFKLNTQIRTQTSAFIRGLQDVVNPAWLQLFSSSELQRLISGSGQVDIKDWQAHTVYNGWSESDFLNGPIAWFWEVVSSFSDSERQQLLLFATSCSRAPLLGFAALSPKFCINVSDGSSSSLPTASTCMNLLRLPRYRSKANLREKVLVAISSQSGFELS
jgi:ubiquitin-protein ligase E3 C